MEPLHEPTAETPAFVLRRISAPRQAGSVFCALVLATVACVGMVLAQGFLKAQGPSLLFLIWNLVLAWIPLVFSFAAYRCFAYRTRRNVLFVACATAWFIFFPNAPYITTDVVHLHDDNISSWFHLIAIMAYAWTGLCLGYVSLYLMQEVVRARFGRVVEWIFVLAMLGAGTLGVYVGRFLRWNSYDFARHPLGYLRWAYRHTNRVEHAGSPSFVAMMFLFLLLSYGVLYSLTHLHEPDGEPA